MRFRRLWLIRNGFWKWWYDREAARWTRWLVLGLGLMMGVGVGVLLI